MTELADRLEDTPADVEQAVTPLELFFDLVFVFAITQVTGFVSADPTWTRLVEGLAILTALWWAWESYVWLGNTAGSDEGTVRVVLLSAMGAMLIASLAVPRAFGDDGVIFGVAYLAVRVLHLGAYAIVSRDDPQLRYVVVRMATTMLPASAADRRGRRAGRHRAGAHVGGGAGGRLRRPRRARHRGLARRGRPLRRAPRPGHHHRAGRVDRRARRRRRGARARRRHHRRRAAGGRGRGRAVVGVLRLRRAGRRARACATRRARRAGPHRARLLHLPAPADGGRDRALRPRGEEDAGPRRRRARGGAGGRAVRRRGALPGRAERAEAAQHRLVQLPAAGGRGAAGGAGAGGDGDAGAAGAGARGGSPAADRVRDVRYADTRDRVRHG